MVAARVVGTSLGAGGGPFPAGKMRGPLLERAVRTVEGTKRGGTDCQIGRQQIRVDGAGSLFRDGPQSPRPMGHQLGPPRRRKLDTIYPVASVVKALQYVLGAEDRGRYRLANGQDDAVTGATVQLFTSTGRHQVQFGIKHSIFVTQDSYRNDVGLQLGDDGRGEFMGART